MKGVIFMEKKNWSNPELRQAEVVDTHATECDCDALNEQGDINFIGKDGHPCHKNENNPSHNVKDDVDVPGQGKGHVKSVGCPIHGDKCCCYSQSGS